MKRSQKFLFDTCFDAEEPARPAPAAPLPPEPEPEPEPSFTLEELEAARAEGLAAGHAQGVQETMAAQASGVAQALDAIGAAVQELLGQQASALAKQEQVALATASAIVRKLFPKLAASQGLAEIEQIIRDCLERLREEPRIVVRVADPLLDSLRDRITGLAHNAGFDGKIVLLTDETLAVDGVRVEWADGGAERDSARVWQAIEAVTGEAGHARQSSVDATDDAQQTEPSETGVKAQPCPRNAAHERTPDLARSA